MNRDLIQGNWNQFKGRLRVRWWRLVGDHLGVISGTRTQSAGERQVAYGVLRANTLQGVLRNYSSTSAFRSRPTLR
jgi:uncharacterized protein YjbJ (UPF0337 family)